MPILAPALTTVVQTAQQRVDVTISGWDVDGPVDVYRIHPDGSRWQVRGAEGVYGGVGVAFDDEAPFMVPLRYVARNGAGTEYISDPVVINEPGPWLSVPGIATMSSAVQVMAEPSPARQRPSAYLSPMQTPTPGQPVFPLAIHTAQVAPSFALDIRAKSIDAANAILTMTATAPVLLLRMPGTLLPWQYVSVSAVTPSPVVPYRRMGCDGAGDNGEVGEWYDVRLACQVTSRPVGGYVGDPDASWQALLDDGLTWQDLLDRGLTWLDLLQRGWD